jgi:hypothetical protein
MKLHPKSIEPIDGLVDMDEFPDLVLNPRVSEKLISIMERAEIIWAQDVSTGQQAVLFLADGCQNWMDDPCRVVNGVCIGLDRETKELAAAVELVAWLKAGARQFVPGVSEWKDA